MSGGRGLKPCEFHSSDFRKPGFGSLDPGACAPRPREGPGSLGRPGRGMRSLPAPFRLPRSHRGTWRPRVVTSLQPTPGRVSWPGVLPVPAFPNVQGLLPVPPACLGIKRGQTRWAWGRGERETVASRLIRGIHVPTTRARRGAEMRRFSLGQEFWTKKIKIK